MPINEEVEQAIIVAAKFTLPNGELKIEFDPHPQVCSTNMLRMLRDRCDELIAIRSRHINPTIIV